MKNQYFGDVNDYLKYGLLRCCTEAGWRVGVCWMLTPDDNRSDGNKTRYLVDPSRWRGYDSLLFDALAAAVAEGRRSVDSAQSLGIISGAQYYDRSTPDSAVLRSQWFDQALARLSATDLLFFDPDNGLEVPSVRAGRRGSSKYLLWSEVERAWDIGASLLLFQHFARENRTAHIQRLQAEAEARAPGSVITPNRHVQCTVPPSRPAKACGPNEDIDKATPGPVED